MASFMQSPDWQTIQELMGRPTRRLASVLVIQHDLPLGFHYLYCPRPPQLPVEFFTQTVELATKTGSLFLKVDPAEELKIGPSTPLGVKNWKLKVFPSHPLQPRSTLLIECQKSDGELLAGMHPKTRYNIRLAERHGVAVRSVSSHGTDAGNQFWQLLVETSRREGFSPHPNAHYQILLDAKSRHEFSNELWLAEWQGELLAAAIVNWYRPSNTVTYLHGASSRGHRDKMAPHLLHWRIIQRARERGFPHYDLGGIDPERWPGVSRFKQGFGGREYAYPPSYDMVFRPALYRFYRLQRSIRRSTWPSSGEQQ